jgi:D-xylose 1-dehydrogenase (NADP+, D-xylono-1,5-lactone-forming)
MNVSRILNWGLLGTARIAASVLPPLGSSRRNCPVGIASRDLDRARAFAATWQLERAYGSYAEMLADPDIDVVYNALPNALHAEWTIRALEAGKHVLCEKPIALTVSDVDAIAAAAARTQRVAAEAFMYRHHPQTALVKQLAADGSIGEVRIVRGAFRFVLDRDGDVRWDPALGGGSLWDVGCYPVSYARFVLGAEPEEVMGWQRTTDRGVDETFVGQMRFPNGVLMAFDCSLLTPFAAQFEIIGTKGTLRVGTPYKPGLQNDLELTDTEGQCRVVHPDGQNLYSGEVEDLAAAILDGAAPRVSLAESRGNIAALMALYGSAQSGRPCRVGEDV